MIRRKGMTEVVEKRDKERRENFCIKSNCLSKGKDRGGGGVKVLGMERPPPRGSVWRVIICKGSQTRRRKGGASSRVGEDFVIGLESDRERRIFPLGYRIFQRVRASWRFEVPTPIPFYPRSPLHLSQQKGSLISACLSRTPPQPDGIPCLLFYPRHATPKSIPFSDYTRRVSPRGLEIPFISGPTICLITSSRIRRYSLKINKF